MIFWGTLIHLDTLLGGVFLQESFWTLKSLLKKAAVLVAVCFEYMEGSFFKENQRLGGGQQAVEGPGA